MQIANKIPPSNIETEKTVLGAIMAEPSKLADVSDYINAESFYYTNHQKIFATMLDLFANGEPIDPISVCRKIEQSGDETDYRAYIATLYNDAYAPSSAVYHAKEIDKLARIRQIIRVNTEILSLAYEIPGDINGLVDKLETLMVGCIKERRKYSHIKDILKDEHAYIEALCEGKTEIIGAMTGYYDIDFNLGGFKPSNFIILAARPAVGKSALMLSMANKMKEASAIFSLEMSKSELAQRLIAINSNISTHNMRTGKISGDNWDKINAYIIKAADKDIIIDDTPNLNIIELRSKARQISASYDIGVLFIDYLQLMNSHKRFENRNQEVTAISRGLKLLARELNIPVVALSQLSRAVEQRQNKRPQLSDLRESGSLEQDADIVMFLHKEDSEDGDRHELLIAKNRQGPVCVVPLTYIDYCTRFESKAKDNNVPF